MFVSLSHSFVEAPRRWCWEVGPLGGDKGSVPLIKEAGESSLAPCTTCGHRRDQQSAAQMRVLTMLAPCSWASSLQTVSTRFLLL